LHLARGRLIGIKVPIQTKHNLNARHNKLGTIYHLYLVQILTAEGEIAKITKTNLLYHFFPAI
jgi:hypothetical protein